MNAVDTSSYLDTSQAVARYRDMVYGIALTHTHSRTDADDVFQEVFLTYHRKRLSFFDDERRKAWLIVTTLNCAKRATASSWQAKIVPLHEHVPDERHDDRFRFRTDEQDAVFAALQELPNKYRTVLHLHYFEDMSIAQICTALCLEAGTVKVQLSRGRAQMREKLKGEYFDD
jgi:RNA polymerase sigma-70 factor (ECF subfamily)